MECQMDSARRMTSVKQLNLFLKRTLDISLALLGFIIFSPLWLLIPLAIFLEDGRPILFLDKRVGKDMKPYTHFKFRSMIKEAEAATGPVWSQEEDARITRIGRILRATAMDELPQLINILKGDMSFVGPRPEREYFVQKFIKEIPGYEKRFEIRPGLTGMAQVLGKHDTPPEEKLKLDLAYIKDFNFFLDLKFLFASFLITLKRGWERFKK